MMRVFAVVALLVLLCLGGIAQAAITIDTVAVGNAGNAADTRDASPGYGSVGYNYKIGKYEVTAGQYTAFLNKVAATDAYGLYNSYMWGGAHGCKIQQSGADGSYTYSVDNDWANRPVNYVGFWDACRFANWLHNGQPTGLQNEFTTERGAYTLDGYAGEDGRTIVRNAGAQWAVASEDEWYKAAYYKSGGTNAGYWDYPMQSDVSTTPSNDLVNPDGGNNANFHDGAYTIGSPYYLTEVGEFENSESAYDTFDQGGNVWEWNDTLTYASEYWEFTARGLRGGSFYCSDYNGYGTLQASTRSDYCPTGEDDFVGFRVSQVPEPSSIIALLGGLAGLMGRRRRRA